MTNETALREIFLGLERRLKVRPDDTLEDDRRDKLIAYSMVRSALILLYGHPQASPPPVESETKEEGE